MCCTSACWRETLFAFLQRNAERSAAFFGVPAGQVVEFGTELEIWKRSLGGIDRERPYLGDDLWRALAYLACRSG